MYRSQREIDYKGFLAQWSGPNGPDLMAVVMVKMQTGDDTFRIYASTNKERVATDIIEEYAGRWAIEPTNRELKQGIHAA